MSRSSEQLGPNIEQALASAVADLLGCDDDQVRVEITADGLDALPTPTRVRLEIDQAEEEHVAEERDEGVEESTDTSSDAPDGDDETESAPVAEPEPPVSTSPDRSDGPSDEEIDAEADAAADFLEGLLDALDLPGDLRINVREDHAEIELVDIGSGALIGRRGQTLEAIQELVRCSLQREFQRRSRVMVDAEGYRARRLEKLIEKADEAIDNVLESGEPERLEPMDVFERKAIHHLVAEVDGVDSRSQGREPSRRIVIEPA